MYALRTENQIAARAIEKLMSNKNSHRSRINEVCGFGLGCLLGGLLGAVAGLLSSNETVVILYYCIGFIGGGFVGASAMKRLTMRGD